MNADRIAPVYRWIEWLAFGGALQRCRCRHLSHLRAARRILILGEGDGRFLAELLRQIPADSPPVSIDVVDSSAAMLRLARRRTSPQAALNPALRELRFFHQDALAAPLPGADYDAVVTNFFLDCLSPPQAVQLTNNVSAALGPGGLWLVAEFSRPDRGWRRWHAEIWLRTMFLFFRWTTKLVVTQIPPYVGILRAANFVLLKAEPQRFHLLTAEVWQHNGTAERRNGQK